MVIDAHAGCLLRTLTAEHTTHNRTRMPAIGSGRRAAFCQLVSQMSLETKPHRLAANRKVACHHWTVPLITLEIFVYESWPARG